jgi:hypothetical protein
MLRDLTRIIIVSAALTLLVPTSKAEAQLPPDQVPIEDQLGACLPSTDVAWGFDNQTKEWSSFAPEAPLPLQMLLEFEAGRGYFIHISSDCTLSWPNNALELVAGWNLIGWQPTGLVGGVLATFEVVDNTFSVWVTNETTIQQLFDLWAGASSANIPNGRILRGPGEAGHNEAWSWHLDPEEIEMAEATIELCDGTPSYVEETLDYWVDTVGYYCPWSAELIRLYDFR